MPCPASYTLLKSAVSHMQPPPLLPQRQDPGRAPSTHRAQEAGQWRLWHGPPIKFCTSRAAAEGGFQIRRGRPVVAVSVGRPPAALHGAPCTCFPAGAVSVARWGTQDVARVLVCWRVGAGSQCRCPGPGPLPCLANHQRAAAAMPQRRTPTAHHQPAEAQHQEDDGGLRGRCLRNGHARASL